MFKMSNQRWPFSGYSLSKPSEIEGSERRPKISADFRRLIELVISVLFSRLTHENIRALCILSISIFCFIFSTTFAFRLGGRTAFGPNLGADFAGYYIAGVIYNRSKPEQIYDRQSSEKLYHDLFPDTQVPPPQPFRLAPLLIAPFSFLGEFDYPLAYFLWALGSLCLYLCGFAIFIGTLKALSADAKTTAFYISLSYLPFMIETLAGGRLSALGFFSLASAIGLERRRRLFFSGLALSLCWYKPSLLLFVAPMLLITKRIRTLDGFLIGSGLWIAGSLLLGGRLGCRAYLIEIAEDLRRFPSLRAEIKPWKFIDLTSVINYSFKQNSQIGWVLLTALFVCASAFLVRCWQLGRGGTKNDQALLWSASITCASLFGLSMGVSDASLLIISALLTLHFIIVRERNGGPPVGDGCKLILISLFLAPCITQPLARSSGFQLLTLSILLLGGYQFYLIHTRILSTAHKIEKNIEKENESISLTHVASSQ